MQRLFNEYGRTKVLRAEFEAKRNKAQEDIESRRAPLLELDRKLKDEADTLSDEERTALEERFNEERANWIDYATDKDKELRREEQRMEKDLLQDLQKAVNDYGTHEGYSIIFRMSLLLYGAQTYDLTDEVLQNVNQ